METADENADRCHTHADCDAKQYCAKDKFWPFKTSVSNLELLMRDVVPTMSAQLLIIVGMLVQMMLHLQTNFPMEKVNVCLNILKIS